MPDFKHVIGGIGHVVGGATRALAGENRPSSEDERRALLEQMAGQADQQIAASEQAGQAETAKPFTLPPLDPNDPDYAKKKEVHDALEEYVKLAEAQQPKVDYHGILKQRMEALKSLPEEHRANPLVMFAMGLGNPEHAKELIESYTAQHDTKRAEELSKWKDMFQMQQDAVEGAAKQAMAAGDARKVATGKWLEEMQRMAKLKQETEAEIQKIGKRGENAKNRAEIQGKWAAKAAQVRAGAVLEAAGVRAGTTEFNRVMSSIDSRIRSRIAKGEDPVDAHDAVLDEVHADYDELVAKRPRGAAPAAAAAATTPTAKPLSATAQKIAEARAAKAKSAPTQ